MATLPLPIVAGLPASTEIFVPTRCWGSTQENPFDPTILTGFRSVARDSFDSDDCLERETVMPRSIPQEVSRNENGEDWIASKILDRVDREFFYVLSFAKPGAKVTHKVRCTLEQATTYNQAVKQRVAEENVTVEFVEDPSSTADLVAELGDLYLRNLVPGWN